MASTGNVEKLNTGDVQKANKNSQRYVPKSRSSKTLPSNSAVPTVPKSTASHPTNRRNNYHSRHSGSNRWSYSDQNAETNITLILENALPAYFHNPYALNGSLPPTSHGQYSDFYPSQCGNAHYCHNSPYSQAHPKAIISDEYQVGNGFPCSNYNHGRCKWKNSCYNRHAPDDKSEQDKLKRNVCVYFLLKRCTKSNCAYLHDDSQLPHGWWCNETFVQEAQNTFDQSALQTEYLALQLRIRFASRNVFVPEGCRCLEAENRRLLISEVTSSTLLEPQKPKDDADLENCLATEPTSDLVQADSPLEVCVGNDSRIPSQLEENASSVVKGDTSPSRATTKLGAATSQEPESSAETQPIA